MKVSKKQLVDSIIDEVMKGISTRVREIIREEFDIESRRFKKRLLEEIRAQDDDEPDISAVYEPRQKKSQPVRKPVKKIDTGDQAVNAILEDVQADMESMMPELTFMADTNVQDVSQKMVTEHHEAAPEHGKLWKPAKGEAYNFDPRSMDPAMINWEHMVDALDNRDALPGDRK